MRQSQSSYLPIIVQVFFVICFFGCKGSVSGSDGKYSRQGADSMIQASRGTLSPVYGPLAEHIVSKFDLKEKRGIGIDLGSGPGTLIIELCKRTQLHWVNADINPNFFPYFYKQAEKRGVGNRVSAVFTDAHDLAFRDGYADIIVSRGSFYLWENKKQAFREIYRVLKPGGVAYIGRGFSENLPVETAKKIRKKQGKKMRYDVEKSSDELKKIMDELGIKKYRIYIPRAGGSEDVNYGIWLEFQKF